jgi:hypothetical protein
MTTPFPSVLSPETAGVTAPALVMAVAMRRGQPAGPTSDQDIEDFIYDALDLLPGASDVEIRCDGGRTTLSGTVSQKRLKRDVGEIAWAIPGINDVHNNITIAPRRRSRAQSRDTEPSAVAGRKTGVAARDVCACRSRSGFRRCNPNRGSPAGACKFQQIASASRSWAKSFH